MACDEGVTDVLAPAQTNLKLGEASQLVGGYTAAVLGASCVIAAVYLGLLVRCVMQLSKGSSTAASGCGQPVKLKHLLRPLGSYLWPVALTLMYGLPLTLIDCAADDVVGPTEDQPVGIFACLPAIVQQ